MNNEYVYLRNITAVKGSEPNSFESTTPVIETAELSKKDLADFQRDPNILAFTPNLPTSLIEPVSSPDRISDNELNELLDSVEENNSTTNIIQDTSEHTWGVKAVRADQSSYTGKGAVIAILDTGIDPTHERFKGVNIVQRNFTDQSDSDENGHGTHCAGTIFGQNIEGQPRIGIAPDIEKALIGKVLGDNGGSTAWISAGIEWAASNGAHVISMSLGYSIHNSFNRYTQDMGYSLQNALSRSLDDYLSTLKFYNAIVKYNQGRKQDAVIIAATGNDSGRFKANPYDAPSGLPAIAEGIISVGALGRIGDMKANVAEPAASQMTAAPFSNYNNDISAPGYRVISAKPNDKYTYKNGTSMATPHVAGVAALWVQKQLESRRFVDSDMLRHQLQGNATMKAVLNDLPEIKVDYSDIGVGLVQAPL